MRLQPQLFEALADDATNRVQIVALAATNDHLGRTDGLHGCEGYAIRPA